MKSSDERLSFRPYRQTLESVQTQFDLLRFCLKLLKPKDRKRFLQEAAERKIAQLEERRLEAKDLRDEEVDPIFDLQIATVSSNMRKACRSGNLHALSEFTEDRLNQSELLLLVAHFESFMKLVHEKYLYADPRRVFAKGHRDKQNPKIAIKSVFSSKFEPELIETEVRWLDAQSIKFKAKYFGKNFSVHFGTADEIKSLIEIMKRRNQISHEVYEPPKDEDKMLKETLEQGKQQALVDTPMLEQARHFFYRIPLRCIEHGRKTYQSYFK